MEICVKGTLMECVTKKSKDGSKEYYSLSIYNNSRLYNVGVPKEIHDKFLDRVGTAVEVVDVNLWCNGNYSLYIRG